MMATSSRRAEVKWVPIELVIPNPLNPRKNDSIRSDEMRSIISRRGWEEPLTVYQKGKVYVVLAGHRRLFSAKESGIKEIPIFIVDAPENHQEEIERIASLQRGRVDWEPFEWMKFTYERYLAWGSPKDITQFSKEINIDRRTVNEYITIMTYYPRHEIEHGLLTEVYSISALFHLYQWIQSAKKHKPQVVEDMTEEMVRKTMLKKLEKKLFARDIIRKDKFVEVSSDDDFRDFLISSDMKMADAQEIYHVSTKEQQRSFHSYVVSMGMLKSTMSKMMPSTQKETERTIEVLNDLKASIEAKIQNIENTMK
jgi:ParB family transcriptional regulator, chromosome partitioning protein